MERDRLRKKNIYWRLYGRRGRRKNKGKERIPRIKREDTRKQSSISVKAGEKGKRIPGNSM